jgi:predicted nuclease of predicted toxin-antitoxin system
VTSARLLLDEMLSPKIGAALEAHGHDVAVVTQRPDLMALHDDEPILAAADDDRVIVTANRAKPLTYGRTEPPQA